MGTATAIALIGASATVGTAIAGYIYNSVNARLDRSERRELAAATRDHEQSVRRGDRAYQDRKDVYRRVMRWALVEVQRVELTQPVVTFEGMPDPPEPPSEDEWRELHVELNVLGSPDVDAAFEQLLEKRRGFYGRANMYRLLVQQRAVDEEVTTNLLQSREDVHQAFDQLRKTIRDELAAL